MAKFNPSEYFGKKIRFTGDVHSEIKNKDFCVLGIQENAVAVIEWDKRGDYDFGCLTLYYTLKSINDIEIIKENSAE